MTLSPLWLLASGGGLLLIGMVIGFWLGIANERTEAEYKREYMAQVDAMCDEQFGELMRKVSTPPDFCFHPLYHATRPVASLEEVIGTKIVEVSE